MQYPKTLDVHEITGGQIFWCDEDTANTPYKAGLTDAVQGIVLCSAGSAAQGWATNFYIEHSGDGLFVQFKSGEVWHDWVQLAKCEAPEVHDLPLADHWEPRGDGLCWYTRNQFGEVSIGMLVRSTSTVSVDGTQFATMPEGFRPRVTVVAPANVTANDYSHSVCHVTINPDGGVYLHFDASSLSGKTVVQLVCPVFHYPAK